MGIGVGIVSVSGILNSRPNVETNIGKFAAEDVDFCRF